MNPSEEFLRHAADCQRMAKFTHDPTSKVTWTRMAERWFVAPRCSRARARPQSRRNGSVPTPPTCTIEAAERVPSTALRRLEIFE